MPASSALSALIAWLLVAVLVVLAIRSSPPLLARTRAAVSARMGAVRVEGRSCDPLPEEWSWQSLTVSDAARWARCFGRAIAPGTYTSPVFDQHVSKWCGCCYLVSVVQMIQDRLHVALGMADPKQPMFPCFSFNMQVALDTYNAAERTENPEWNACKGGMPVRVINAVRAGKCLLRLQRDGEVWLGHPSSIDGLGDARSPVVTGPPQTLPNQVAHVKRRVYKYGPVVLGINSKCFLHPHIVSEGGLIDATEWAPPDHALTVVGWKVVRGRECWIVRNSWGRRTVPAGRPDDVSCVGEGFNRCDTGTNEWIGDVYNPGYAYVPTDYRGIWGLPSPWFDTVPEALSRALPPTTYDTRDAFDEAGR